MQAPLSEPQVQTSSRAHTRVNATRKSLAVSVQRRLGFSQSESRRLVDDVFDVMSDFLIERGKMKISTFGSFDVRSKSARIGRNLKTGEIVPIAPRRVVSFRPSVDLRERLKFDAGDGNKK